MSYKRKRDHPGQPWTRNKRRTARRTKRRPDPYSDSAPHAVKLMYIDTTINSNVTSQYGGINFQLDKFNGFASYSAAFDSYRLRKVAVIFIPRVNDHTLANKATATTTVVAGIFTCKDYDDSSAPSSLGEIMEYGNAMIHGPFEQFEMKLRPKISMAAYQSGAFTGYTQADDTTWIDCASDDVEHYGIKWGTAPCGGSQTTFQDWDVYVKGWLEFRQNR